jgi:hypothetical protein
MDALRATVFFETQVFRFLGMVVLIIGLVFPHKAETPQRKAPH